MAPHRVLGSALPSLPASITSTSGVREGCVLAPALFCRAIDWITKGVASTVGFSLGDVHFTDLDYGDDVALLPYAMDDLERSSRQQRHNLLYMSPGRRRK